MRNRTIYNVLDNVMENYFYSVNKCGKKIDLVGKVYIERIDQTVVLEKSYYCNTSDELIDRVKRFKEEVRMKVAEVVKEHAEELTDDEAMIEKMQYEIKTLREALGETEEELKKAREEITRLELERIGTQPYPWTNPAPWSTGTTPWSTGITWETPYVGDRPGWLDNTITCESNGEFNTNNIANILADTVEHPEQIKYRRLKHNRKNGGER